MQKLFFNFTLFVLSIFLLYACLGECSSVGCAPSGSFVFILNSQEKDTLTNSMGEKVQLEDISIYNSSDSSKTNLVSMPNSSVDFLEVNIYPKNLKEEYTLEIKSLGKYKLNLKFSTSDSKCCGIIWRTEEMLFNDNPIPRSTPYNYPILIIP